jgi:PAS domain S-box-containing protein
MPSIGDDGQPARNQLPSQEREGRRLEQSRVLVELARGEEAASGDLEAAFERITRTAAETLGVERTSVWLYNDDRSAIRCADLYELPEDRHSRGQELSAESYPSYFQALETERTIAAHDARSDPRTAEFAATYLEPLGISSMLDAPIRVRGRMIGVVCHEHVGPGRQWRGDEQNFAGSVADAVSLAVEESERRRTEAALRESEERYRKIVETALEGIWTIDAVGRTTYANPRMAEMLGYSVEELLGRNAFDLVPAEDMASAREHWDLRRQGISDRPEFRFIRKDGSTLWGQCSATALLDEAGGFAGAIAMVVDVTRRKQAEAEREELLAREQAARAEAEAANRIKDEFLATVSHELRTPLNAMIGWVHLLRAGGLDAATAERALETIERNVRAQSQIVDDILDVSRIIRGSLTLSLQPVDLAGIVHHAVESLRPAAQTKGIALHTILEPTSGEVVGDPDRLQQVAWNLLANAVKFTPRGGSVEVRLSRQGDDLRLEVTDTGEGISPEFLPYVFERFRQADGSTSRVHGGLGLGLAIVRHLIELQGGTVSAESAGKGRGARFTVTLPAATPAGFAAPEMARTGKDPEALPLDGLRLLVVDDDLDTCEAMSLLLSRAGARVAIATSVPEAFAAFERSRPDVLISDIGMPGEDGYELIRRLRERGPEEGGAVPAVALTAYARPEDREQALAAGYQAHLAKPVDAEELTAVLAGLAVRR